MIVELSGLINPSRILLNNKSPKHNDTIVDGRDININSRMN